MKMWFRGRLTWVMSHNVVPSLHPMYAVGSGEVNHTRGFNQVTNTLQAHDRTRLTATTLALTCIDVLKGGEDLVKKIKEKFIEQKSLNM